MSDRALRYPDDGGSSFVRHAPCESCGSRDNNGVYSDGHTHCFGCGAHVSGDGAVREEPSGRKPVTGLLAGEVQALTTRGITAVTAAKFGYMVGTQRGKTVQIAPYYDKDSRLVAQKLRDAKKKFAWAGDSSDAMPFGFQAWPRTGKMLVVTEGELDALSMSQAQGNKWPVVSIGCGAGPQVKKYFGKHREYFRGFEKIVLMFDMDDPGREAAKVAAQVLGSRAAIAELPMKDANEMLRAGRVEELIGAMWRAKEYRPDGIVELADLRDKIMLPPVRGLSWPFPSLTEMTFGLRPRELITIGAGTGIGKTDFCMQTVEHLIVEHGQSVGVFALETAPTDTAIRILGKQAGKPFHVPGAGWSDAEKQAALDTVAGAGRLFLYDSFGSNQWEHIRAHIEYLHYDHGVRFFLVDHLTALASWQDDERRALEVIMSEIGALVQTLDSTILLVSHLATPEGKSHEEGGRVQLRHLKGARAIAQWSSFVIGLERDQQNDVGGSTTVRVLKDRFTGRSTGQMFAIGYDYQTGLLSEVEGSAARSDAASFGFQQEDY